MTFVYFILILVVLVIIHEFGHFIVAKLSGICVDEFGIFFPPRIAAIKRGETEYSINWLPFGGFVKIFGENGETNERSPDALVGVPTSEAERRNFVNKPRYVQAAVIVAGIVFNLIFAWLVLSAGYMAGIPTSPGTNTVGTVTNVQVMVTDVLPSSPAEKSGLLASDQIEDIQTATAALDVRSLAQTQNSGAADAVTNFILAHQDESVVITVLRDGQQKTFLAKAAEGIVAGHKAIGVELSDVGTLKLGLPQALVQGAVLGYDITVSTAQGLATFFKQLITLTANFNDVSGPIGITVFGAATLKQGWVAAALLTALISINLAIINIIPIPGLDGGRLLIIGIEAVIRRPVNPSIVMKATMVGFALLILLMVVVSYHDIVRLVG
ncbi:MAG TPA: site-2 protease family protein [Candidatus Paceibacterota bacterium]|nr:site-2 protease family protein [Candidatus Paceibacterota bacterium]